MQPCRKCNNAVRPPMLLKIGKTLQTHIFKLNSCDQLMRINIFIARLNNQPSDISLWGIRGVNVAYALQFMDLLREDRKGSSLGTDILCWTTPHSYRQDFLRFQWEEEKVNKGLSLPQRLIACGENRCRYRDYNERFECEEVRLTLPLPRPVLFFKRYELFEWDAFVETDLNSLSVI